MNDSSAISNASEAPTPAPARVLPNPLHDQHAGAGAEFQAYADLQIVSTFGEPQAEYAAIRKACALLDEPQRGVLELTGKDRLAFLNNLLTNQTWDKAKKSALLPGTGVYAFLLNTKGRIVTDVNVLERGDRTLLEMDARLVAPVRRILDKYIIVDQVTLADRVGEVHSMSLHGPGAPVLLDSAVGSHVVELPPIGSTQVGLFGSQTIVWRDDACGVSGLHLLVPASDAVRVWTTLLQQFGQLVAHAKRPVRAAGWAAFNACRIEAGRPIFGIDFDDSILPAETGQFDRAVSVTKGCYLGQEVVARMFARKQLAKQLVGLRLDDDSLPIAGAQLFDDQSNAIGGVMSSTVSPVLSNIAICLGYLKKPFFAEGTVVTVPAEGAMRKATVVKTPFIPAPT